MDVLLQSLNTGRYLKRELTWTTRREEAFVFISSAEAIDFATEQRLQDVQLVLFFREAGHSLVVPFQPEHCDSTPPGNSKSLNSPAN